jgi:5-formyltetrahydrofolate cyclo-ligase
MPAMTSRAAEAKQALRKAARVRRSEFSAAHGASPWQPAAHKLGERFDRSVVMASYRARGSEADPAAIEAIAKDALADVSYPRVDQDGVMRFYALGSSRAMDRDRFGIEVPAADGLPSDPSIILVPLLAFDRSGMRLGQGGGHYDRALKAAALSMAEKGCTLLKIGIAWSVQEFTDLPCESWDVRLDAILTEKEWIAI